MISTAVIDRNLHRLLLISAVMIAVLLHLPLAEQALGRDQGNWSTAVMAIDQDLIF